MTKKVLNLENPRYNATHHKALSVRLMQLSHTLTPLILRALMCAARSILGPLLAKRTLFFPKLSEEEDDEEDKVEEESKARTELKTWQHCTPAGP